MGITSKIKNALRKFLGITQRAARGDKKAQKQVKAVKNSAGAGNMTAQVVLSLANTALQTFAGRREDDDDDDEQ